MTGSNENVIEFLRDQKTATCTFCQQKFINRIRKLAASHPKDCQIVAENKDGSIVGHIPTSWIKLNPPKQISDKQRETLRQNLLNAQHIGHEKG